MSMYSIAPICKACWPPQWTVTWPNYRVWRTTALFRSTRDINQDQLFNDKPPELQSDEKFREEYRRITEEAGFQGK